MKFGYVIDIGWKFYHKICISKNLHLEKCLIYEQICDFWIILIANDISQRLPLDKIVQILYSDPIIHLCKSKDVCKKSVFLLKNVSEKIVKYLLLAHSRNNMRDSSLKLLRFKSKLSEIFIRNYFQEYISNSLWFAELRKIP